MAAASGPNTAGGITEPLLLSNGDAVISIPSGGHEPPPAPSPLVIAGAAVPPLELPPASPADPFVNRTASVGGFYELCKIVVLLPVVAVRLVVWVLALVVGYAVTWVALVGWDRSGRQSEPLPKWRRSLMWITRICARIILFAFGYHWIKRKGRPAPRELAPIVVSNHVSYIDPIYFFYELFPTIVSSDSHDSIPVVGMIIRAMQVIYVDRFSPASRKFAVNEIKRKASSNNFPRVLLFPEGTTSNGRFLLSFQHGAFIPGLPVQPVIVRYPYVHFDQSWGNISLARLIFKMLTQVHNFMEVEYLPVCYPPLMKHGMVTEFAEQTRCAMASSLNVLPTSFSYGDSLIVTRALEHAKFKCSSFLVEMAWVKDTYGMSTSEALELLDQFLKMEPDYNGHVELHNFFKAFGLGLSRTSEMIFLYFDTEKIGSITFRQFLVGSVHIRMQPLYWGACETAFSKLCGPRNLRISRKQLVDSLQPKMPCINEDNIGQLYQIFDDDNDGVISKHDFMKCLAKYTFLITLFAGSTEGDNTVEIC